MLRRNPSADETRGDGDSRDDARSDTRGDSDSGHDTRGDGDSRATPAATAETRESIFTDASSVKIDFCFEMIYSPTCNMIIIVY